MCICALCILHSFPDMFVPNICIILRLVYVPNMHYHIAIRTTQEGEIQMKEIEQTITTLEIANMIGMRHSSILRKLEGQEQKGKHIPGIVEILTQHNLVPSDYFLKSTYSDFCVQF